MSFKIGRVRVKISFLFFAMLTMAFTFDQKQLVLITLICSALHEIGHIVPLFWFGGYPDEINFGIFGVRIQQNRCVLTDLQQMVVVLCGPLVNIMLFIAFFVASLIFGGQALMISSVNLVIGAFNLLPIMPLDGGRILLALLTLWFDEERACKTMRLVCAAVLMFLVLSGAILAIKTGANISLLATGIYIFVLCIKSIKI